MNDYRLQRFLLPRVGEPHDVRMLYLIESEYNKQRAMWTDRSSITITAGSEVSFLSYFNAFPASYWRRWSQLDSVILKVRVTGAARIDVYRSKFDGARIGVEGKQVKMVRSNSTFPSPPSKSADGFGGTSPPKPT